MKRVYTFFIIIGILILVWLAGKYFDFRYDKKIRDNLKITNGKIISTEYGGKGSGMQVIYTFENNGENVVGKQHRPFKGEYDNLFVGKTFFVVFDSTESKRNKILLSEKDYNFFAVSLPDSLKWTRKFIDD